MVSLIKEAIIIGLDNGIIMRPVGYKQGREREIAKGFGKPYPRAVHYEVCYWRKCWNIRSIIMEAIGMDDDEYCKKLDVYDIDRIIAALSKVDKTNWADEGTSIWTWNEYQPCHRRYLRNLRRLRRLMEKYNLYVEFYDSY